MWPYTLYDTKKTLKHKTLVYVIKNMLQTTVWEHEYKIASEVHVVEIGGYSNINCYNLLKIVHI